MLFYLKGYTKTFSFCGLNFNAKVCYKLVNDFTMDYPWLIYGLSMAFIRVILGFALRYDVYLCGNMEGADGKFAEGEGREGCSR